MGTAGSIDVDSCNRGRVTLAAKGEPLQTPAGKFTDVVRLDFHTQCADGGVTSAWFAYGVGPGPGQWRESSIAGAVTYGMASGCLGRVVYPMPATRLTFTGNRVQGVKSSIIH